MRQAVFILGAPLALLLAGCVLSGKERKQKANATPPPPKPAASTAATSAPAPSGPLSIPQTVAELPPPQPISADALATIKQPEEPTEAQPATRPPPRRAAQVAGPPRPEPPPAQAQTPPGLPPPDQPERPPIQEILPAGELKRLQDLAQAQKREIKRVLDQTDPRRLNSAQKDLVARIRTLVQLSDEAESKNEMRQAESLASQAQTLVRELPGGR